MFRTLLVAVWRWLSDRGGLAALSLGYMATRGLWAAREAQRRRVYTLA